MFATAAKGSFLIITIVLASFGAHWSVRLAKAEKLSSADSISDRRFAAASIPQDARAWLRLANLEQSRGADALPSFRKAVEANPLYVDAWIEMGLEREMAGDNRAAESDLLHASKISLEYVPRWALLNFYFRRNDAAHFFPWAKEALAIGSGDVQPIFRMAWALSGEADRVAATLPERPLVLRQYLAWLISTQRLQPAENIAARLIRSATEDDVPALLYYCDSQLAQGQVSKARTVWADLAARRLIPATAADTGIVDGHFDRNPTNQGFDWRIPPVEGVSARTTHPGLRVSFSGKQPETCDPLIQYVSLMGGHRYKLSYEYQTSGIVAGSGLAWRVFDPKSATEFTKDPPSLTREESGEESFEFSTPPEVQGGRLALTYRRALGTTRSEGWLQLKHVTLQPAN